MGGGLLFSLLVSWLWSLLRGERCPGIRIVACIGRNDTLLLPGQSAVVATETRFVPQVCMQCNWGDGCDQLVSSLGWMLHTVSSPHINKSEDIFTRCYNWTTYFMFFTLTALQFKELDTVCGSLVCYQLFDINCCFKSFSKKTNSSKIQKLLWMRHSVCCMQYCNLSTFFLIHKQIWLLQLAYLLALFVWYG